MPSDNNPAPEIWAVLQQELEQWSAAGKIATFWWRDDDAIEETPELRRLDALSQETGVPTSLAVIPAQLRDSLPRYLDGRDNLLVLQHGYAHLNHAAAGAKKIELGGKQSTDQIQAQLVPGRQQLERCFADRFIPVLVPPWNRIDSRVYPLLPRLGFCGVSTIQARKTAYPCDQLLQVNTHLDPVLWRREREFIGEMESIRLIVEHLALRRLGGAAMNEPTGILTHHLVQSDATWDFCRALFGRLNQHPAVRWLSATEIWRSGPE